ncbi:MAG: hypothetical protein PHT19_13255 [Methylococcus sp.]|nr:hypothetical protein [Methylococcus sp.]
MAIMHGCFKRAWVLPVSGAIALSVSWIVLGADVSAYDAVAEATQVVGPSPTPSAVAQVTVASTKQSGVKLVVKRSWWSANKDQINATATVAIPNTLLGLNASADAAGLNLLVEFRHSDGTAFADCELDLQKAKKKQAVFAANEKFRKGVLQATIGICDPDLTTPVAEQTIPDVRPGDTAVLKNADGTEYFSAKFVMTK